jgi:hypothetical protein
MTDYIPKEYLTPDYAGFALGILLFLLGVFVPKRFVGIQVDWTPPLSLAAIIIGAVFFAFSYPQLRFWQSNTVNVDRAVIGQLASDAQKGIDSINSARGGSSYPYCFDHASAGLTPLNDALELLKKLGTTK